MNAVYVLTEEKSSAIVVEQLAKVYAPQANVTVLPHSGKSDLVASFPRKMRAIRHPADVRFIVLHDNDGADCAVLKRKLFEFVPQNIAGRAKIRLVMQELEGWYLGQFDALAACELISFSEAARLQNRAKFRDPDRLTNAKQEFYRLHTLKNQQITLARMIAPYLDVSKNNSRSFQLFVSTLQDFAR